MCSLSIIISCTSLSHAAEKIKLSFAEIKNVMHSRNSSSLDTLTSLDFSQNIRISQAESALSLQDDSLNEIARIVVSSIFTRSFTSIKLNALVLVEACLSKRLFFCSRELRRDESFIASDFIFVYEHDASDNQERDDEIIWTFVNFNDVFEILCFTDSSELMKKRMRIRVNDILHHLIFYYIQWNIVNELLKSFTRLLDFQDTILRNKLVAQKNMQFLSSMKQFRLNLEIWHHIWSQSRNWHISDIRYEANQIRTNRHLSHFKLNEWKASSNLSSTTNTASVSSHSYQQRVLICALDSAYLRRQNIRQTHISDESVALETSLSLCWDEHVSIYEVVSKIFVTTEHMSLSWSIWSFRWFFRSVAVIWWNQTYLDSFKVSTIRQ